MIEVINYYAKINLELIDFTKVLRGMNESGYKSVVWQSKQALLNVAGISVFDKNILEWISYYNLNRNDSFVYRGDLFVDDGDIIYIITGVEKWYSSDGLVEIGIITSKENAVTKLREYLEAFTKAVKLNLDGRRVRHMNLKWYSFAKNDKIDAQVSFYKNFTYPILDETETNAAEYLTDVKKRKMMLKIAEVGMLKHIDIKGEDKSQQLEIIEDLITQNLANPRFIITCRKNSTPIGVMESKDEILVQSNNKLSCPHCGRGFADELLQKSYVLSELGSKMTQGSHWMTILITNVLMKIGIPEKNIIWNLVDATEEVDCVVQFKDKVWIFELKDRDFEVGDAHPLMYRAIKFKATKTIIFTSGKVVKAARKVFEDISNQNRSALTSGYPLYIEGISSLKETLKTLIQNETLLHVRDKSKQISRAASINLSPIFFNLFGNYILEHKGEFMGDTNIFRYNV